MPRKPRVHYCGAVYHVMARGNNKEPVFASDRDKNKYLELVKKYKSKYDFSLFAYVLMENHVHLLVQVNDIPLSRIMQGIQLSYTQYFNKKYDRVGHVFQQRYKALLCNKDDYLLTLIKYFHLNPVRAGIGKLDYAWSSHKAYVKGIDKLVDVEFPLSLFSNDRNKAVKYYITFMSDHQEEAVPLVDHQLSQDATQIEKKEPFNELVCKMSVNDLLKLVSQETSVPAEMILKRNKKPDIVRARKMFIYLAIDCGILTRTEVAKFIGLGQSSVTRAFNAVEMDEKLMFQVKSMQNIVRENCTK